MARVNEFNKEKQPARNPSGLMAKVNEFNRQRENPNRSDPQTQIERSRSLHQSSIPSKNPDPPLPNNRPSLMAKVREMNEKRGISQPISTPSKSPSLPSLDKDKD